MYKSCTSAESILNERSDSTAEHKKEMIYDSNEHLAYMLENSSVEDEITPYWDTTTLQNMLFDNGDTEENYDGRNVFLTFADNNIMLLKVKNNLRLNGKVIA